MHGSRSRLTVADSQKSLPAREQTRLHDHNRTYVSATTSEAVQVATWDLNLLRGGIRATIVCLMGAFEGKPADWLDERALKHVRQT